MPLKIPDKFKSDSNDQQNKPKLEKYLSQDLVELLLNAASILSGFDKTSAFYELNDTLNRIDSILPQGQQYLDCAMTLAREYVRIKIDGPAAFNDPPIAQTLLKHELEKLEDELIDLLDELEENYYEPKLYKNIIRTYMKIVHLHTKAMSRNARRTKNNYDGDALRDTVIPVKMNMMFAISLFLANEFETASKIFSRIADQESLPETAEFTSVKLVANYCKGYCDFMIPGAITNEISYIQQEWGTILCSGLSRGLYAVKQHKVIGAIHAQEGAPPKTCIERFLASFIEPKHLDTAEDAADFLRYMMKFTRAAQGNNFEALIEERKKEQGELSESDYLLSSIRRNKEIDELSKMYKEAQPDIIDDSGELQSETDTKKDHKKSQSKSHRHVYRKERSA